MYNIPQGQITFEKLEAFCNEGNEEGLILDYKIDWPNDLSRVLCGMANVQGGMVLVGVGTQTGTRLPAWPPPGVGGTDDQLNARVVQIAYDAIYPPVFPQIDVVRLPNNPARAVVVIRVDPSRLMHATDDRRRICVRVFDHTRGIQNDPANLSQLEWLFQMREKSASLRKSVLARAAARAIDAFGMLPSDTNDSDTLVSLTVSTIPAFPNPRAFRAPTVVRDAAMRVGSGQPRVRFSGLPVPYISSWRTTADGAFVPPNPRDRLPQYLEAESHGLIYLQQFVPPYDSRARDSGQPIRLLQATHVVAFCEAFLKFAAALYKQAEWFGPVEVDVVISNVQKIALDPRVPGASDPLNTLWYGGYAQDSWIKLYAGEQSANKLAGFIDTVLSVLVRQLLWAFGYPFTPTEADVVVSKLLTR